MQLQQAVIHATGNSHLTHLLCKHRAQHVAADNGHCSSVNLHAARLPCRFLITLIDSKWPSTIDPQTAI